MDKLHQQLATLPTNNGQPRVALVGIGHELRGDDAAGVVMAHLLDAQPHGDGLQIIEAGAAPLNCCGLLQRWRPNLIIFVDAADMAKEPGNICWLNWQDVIDSTGSTHHFSLRVLADYLTREVGCPVSLLGIQPADTAVGAPLSAPVAVAVQNLVRVFLDIFSPTSGEAYA